jgi:tripeptidyl-peptidase I
MAIMLAKCLVYCYLLLNIGVLSLYKLKRTVNHSLRRDIQAYELPDTSIDHAITIAIVQKNIDKLADILYDVSDIASPKYGQHLSFSQIGELVENRDATEAVVQWLTENEVTITHQTRYGEYIKCIAAVSKWEELFHTAFYRYRQNGSVIDIYRALNYSLPDYLQDHIHNVHNLVDLPPRFMSKPHLESVKDSEVSALHLRKREHKSFKTLEFPSSYITPTTLAEKYSINDTGNYTGSQGVYATDGETFLSSDLKTFQAYFSLPNDPVDYYINNPPNSSICYNSLSSCSEASIDVQYLLSVGQTVPSIFYYDPDADGTFLSFITNISDSANPAMVYSISYGSYEVDIDASSIASFNTEAMKLGARGVTIIASSGDDGVSGFSTLGTSYCGYYAQWPASSPYVTAVGGTMNGAVVSTTPEIVCSVSTNSAITSGGGFSNSLASPSFQRSAINAYTSQYIAVQSPQQPYNSSNRGYPDVALAANLYSKFSDLNMMFLAVELTLWHDFVVVMIAGEYYAASGTSASAPSFAGMVALVNSNRLRGNYSTLGWMNPSIYRYIS